jgi:hypothetical protein
LWFQPPHSVSHVFKFSDSRNCAQVGRIARSLSKGIKGAHAWLQVGRGTGEGARSFIRPGLWRADDEMNFVRNKFKQPYGLVQPLPTATSSSVRCAAPTLTPQRRALRLRVGALQQRAGAAGRPAPGASAPGAAAAPAAAPPPPAPPPAPAPAQKASQSPRASAGGCQRGPAPRGTGTAARAAPAPVRATAALAAARPAA